MLKQSRNSLTHHHFRSSTASADSVMTWTETTTASETMSKQPRTSWTTSSYIQLPTRTSLYMPSQLLPWEASGVAEPKNSSQVEQISGLKCQHNYRTHRIKLQNALILHAIFHGCVQAIPEVRDSHRLSKVGQNWVSRNWIRLEYTRILCLINVNQSQHSIEELPFLGV